MDRYQEVVGMLKAFVAERDWNKFHDPKNLSMLVASEAGELLAEYRWVRNADADTHTSDASSRQRVCHEIADVAIGLMLLCDRIGVDLLDVVVAKIEVNRRNYPVGASRGTAARLERE